MIKREELIPMMDSNVTDIPKTILKQKIRPCIPRIFYGFLFLLACSGSVLFSTSFHKVPSGTINIISGSSHYDSKYYFELPWDYTERINVPLQGNVIVFPTLTAQNDREIAVYKKCKLVYDISDIDKFIEAVRGDTNKFAVTLLEDISDYVEENISNMDVFKDILYLDDIDPLIYIDYLSSSAFTCIKKGFQPTTIPDITKSE